jgi:hypothetical protein
VVRSAAKRYALAALAFLASAVWLGVSLTNGLACLLVFVAALQAAQLYQRRKRLRTRTASARGDRPERYDPAPAEVQQTSLPPGSARDRSRASSRIYDGDRESLGWAAASEATR